MIIKKYPLLLCIMLICTLSCSSQTKKKHNGIKSKGVLIAGSTTHYEIPDTIKVLNKNNSIYFNIYKDDNHKMMHPQIDSIAIRAFYPDYDIVIFDAKKKANFYQIFVNGQEKK